MTNRTKAETLAMTPGDYHEAKAAFLADAEALRKGKAPQPESEAPQASTAQIDGATSTSNTSRTPAPHVKARQSALEMSDAEYQAERAGYLARCT
ncbi:hypothetical protein AWB75_07081 [Caballeronia catudaia]|uniref:Uncharacterized protein n=1 Tax=Caballeronia catudaia TaxID=1777136 RepID=A0A158DRI4_9BURK|nr:hypothetical protein [Caballeronia catudaia]SAK97113.1 hypothetical protein AWB75_07081 [Caballeronia catudaia]